MDAEARVVKQLQRCLAAWRRGHAGGMQPQLGRGTGRLAGGDAEGGSGLGRRRWWKIGLAARAHLVAIAFGGASERTTSAELLVDVPDGLYKVVVIRTDGGIVLPKRLRANEVERTSLSTPTAQSSGATEY